MSGTEKFTVSTQAELDAAIATIDVATTPGNYSITFARTITETGSGAPAGIDAVVAAVGVDVTIDGAGFVLNGAGKDGGLVVLGGKVTIESLTIEDTVAKGAQGADGGGGGAGLGGGLFVGPAVTGISDRAAVVTLDDVSFKTNAADGGAGGAGGTAGGGAGGHSSLVVPDLGGNGARGTGGSTGAAGAAGSGGARGGNGDPGGIPQPGEPGRPGGLGGNGGNGGGGGRGGNGGPSGDDAGGGDGGNGGTAATGGLGGLGGQGGAGGVGGAGGAGGRGFTAGGAGGDAGASARGGDGGFGGGGGAGGRGSTGGGGGAGSGSAHNGGLGGEGGRGAAGGAGGFGGGGGAGGQGGGGGADGGGATGVVVFGGGGGGGTGGNGGFGGGGGGGGGGGDGTGKAVGSPGGGPFGAGGFGAGSGAAGVPGDFGLGAGGGGLGAGGDIFVAQGSSLVVDGGLLSQGSVSGGAAGADDGGNSITDAGAGDAFGSGIFLQGSETVTLGAPAGTTLTVAGVIADQTGSGGSGAATGVGGLVISDAGTVKLSAKNTFVGGISIESGTLDLAHTGAAGKGPITFDPGVLEFSATSAPTGAINNFTTADGIIVTGFTLTGDSFAGGKLTLDSAGGNLTLDLPGATAGAVGLGKTSGGNLTIGTVPPPCFVAGTRIATERGEVPVEALRPGDRVRTRRGLLPVVWLGHREVDCRRHKRPQDVLPVRVAPHAFGWGRPARALLLSPDHAVFVGGALIPVRYLLNGASIAQVGAERVGYWHVELPRHAVLFADGLGCESYLDTGNRTAFGNGDVVEAHPDFARGVWRSEACAPLVTDGPSLVRAKSRLLARLARLGHAVTADPALGVEVDGASADLVLDGEWVGVDLPRDAATLMLRSRISRPAELHADSSDTRGLGVALRRLRLDGVDVPLDHACLTAGWHDPEPGWRWTIGTASLDVWGRRRVELALTTWLRYHAMDPQALRVAV